MKRFIFALLLFGGSLAPVFAAADMHLVNDPNGTDQGGVPGLDYNDDGSINFFGPNNGTEGGPLDQGSSTVDPSGVSGCTITSIEFSGGGELLRGRVQTSVLAESGQHVEVFVKTKGVDCGGKNLEIEIEGVSKKSFNDFGWSVGMALSDKTDWPMTLTAPGSSWSTLKTTRVMEESENTSRFFFKPGHPESCSLYKDRSSDDIVPALTKFGSQQLIDGWQKLSDADLPVPVIGNTNVKFCGFVASATIGSQKVYTHKNWPQKDHQKAQKLANVPASEFVAYTCFFGKGIYDFIGDGVLGEGRLLKWSGNGILGALGLGEGIVNETQICEGEWVFVKSTNATTVDLRTSACAGRENCQPLLTPIPGIGEADGTIDTSTINIADFVDAIFKLSIGFGSIFSVLLLVYAGFTYLTPSASNKSKGKSMINNVGMGLLVLVSSGMLLNTVNPDLLNFDINPREVGFVGEVKSRVDDERFMQTVGSVDASYVIIPNGAYSDKLFLTYLTHQQGMAGGAFLLWAANRNAALNAKNPFLSGKNLNKTPGNVRANYFGDTRPVTAKAFLDDWYQKIHHNKTQIGGIPAVHATAIERAAKDTGMDPDILKTMCLIESYKCTDPKAHSPSGNHKGLFQIGDKLNEKKISVWTQHRKNKNSNIYDPYANAYAAANLMKSNLNYIKNKQDIIDG